jgi:nucleoside-diphosphate-sugar epimerase
MRIFITGASGFVGGAAARDLSGGHTVMALSRSAASDAAIRETGAEPMRGDLDTVTADMMRGCDAVIHCAARVDAWGPMQEFWRTNVEGTVRMLEAARKAGVKRFIHIGTEAALFYGQDMIALDEKAPLAFSSPFPYSRTKAHAERAVRAANDTQAGFTTIVLRPRFVWGPGDKTILPRIIDMAETGRFTWIDGGRARTDTAHIANLVHAIRLALDNGMGGEAYFITDGDEPVTFREFLTALAATADVRLPDKSVPGALARALARLLVIAWRLMGRKDAPPLDPFSIAMMSKSCTLVIDKAKRELGYAPVITRARGLQELGNPRP